MLRLTGRVPMPDRESLLAELVVPARFIGARFDTYLPDPAHPSQLLARQSLSDVVEALAPASSRWRLPRRRGAGRPARGVYLDGGFGVGKTHLLAATWSAAQVPRAYGTFVAYTHLVGALGFRETVAALAARRLVCIDEFELDDPGDTVLMARLLRELSDSGVTVIATSNTLPEALGGGRFAAEDFLREIQSLAAAFDVIRIDGPDYRHRGHETPPPVASDADVTALAGHPSAAVDDFDSLLAHLATLHPSRYGALLDGVTHVGWRKVTSLSDQNVALRLVVLVDRLYEREIPVLTAGGSVLGIFGEEMLRGGYRKKYLRAISRLTALTRDVTELVNQDGTISG